MFVSQPTGTPEAVKAAHLAQLIKDGYRLKAELEATREGPEKERLRQHLRALAAQLSLEAGQTTLGSS